MATAKNRSIEMIRNSLPAQTTAAGQITPMQNLTVIRVDPDFGAIGIDDFGRRVHILPEDLRGIEVKWGMELVVPVRTVSAGKVSKAQLWRVFRGHVIGISRARGRRSRGIFIQILITEQLQEQLGLKTNRLIAHSRDGGLGESIHEALRSGAPLDGAFVEFALAEHEGKPVARTLELVEDQTAISAVIRELEEYALSENLHLQRKSWCPGGYALTFEWKPGGTVIATVVSTVLACDSAATAYARLRKEFAVETASYDQA
jgi:hypothetical protein